MSRLDLDEGFSPEGLRLRDEMVKAGYRKESLVPLKLREGEKRIGPLEEYGKPVFDPELDDYLRGMFGEKPTAQEAEDAIRDHRR